VKVFDSLAYVSGKTMKSSQKTCWL